MCSSDLGEMLLTGDEPVRGAGENCLTAHEIVFTTDETTDVTHEIVVTRCTNADSFDDAADCLREKRRRFSANAGAR